MSLHRRVCGGVVPDRASSRCKGPESGTRLAGFGDARGVSGRLRTNGTVVCEEKREIGRARWSRAVMVNL